MRRYCSNPERRSIPEILMVDLCNGHTEITSEMADYPFDHGSFLL